MKTDFKCRARLMGAVFGCLLLILLESIGVMYNPKWIIIQCITFVILTWFMSQLITILFLTAKKVSPLNPNYGCEFINRLLSNRRTLRYLRYGIYGCMWLTYLCWGVFPERVVPTIYVLTIFVISVTLFHTWSIYTLVLGLSNFKK